LPASPETYAVPGTEDQQTWTHDNVTSPCIDAGNPGSPLFDEPVSIDDDIANHWGENVRVNMGAYGGTSQASMAPPGFRLLADLNNDNIVNMRDYAIMTGFVTRASALVVPKSSHEPRATSYDFGDLNHDNKTTIADIAILTDQWLSASPGSL
jgi:hypothetical protein